MRAGLFRVLFCLALLCATPLRMTAALNSDVHHAGKKHHSAHLRWQRPKNSPDKVAGYNIYRSTDGGATFHKLNSLPVRRPRYNDRTVRHGTTYLYQVKSVDAKGRESGPSNWITLKVP